MKRIFTTFLILMFLMSSPFGFAQQRKSEKYQLAITYEQQGDFRNAARLFQELLAENPSEPNYFQGVARSLSALQRYLELMPLIEIELGKRQSIDLFCLASVTAKKSNIPQKSQQYFELANNAVDQLGNDFEIDNAIRLIAQSQSDIGAFDNALSTYFKGRSKLKNMKHAYADELSMLYVQIGNVELGIKEITNLFKQQQQYGIIQGRIAALLINQEADSVIETELASLSKNDFAFSKVYVWFLRETKQYDKAFQQALSIDNGLGLQGREILEFADITLKDGLFDIAMNAYGNILDRGKNNPYFSTALYGYAKSMDQRLQSTSNAEISKTEIQTIINRYKDILAQSPNGQFAAECMYRIGVLQLTYLNDINEARENFEQVMNSFKNYPISARAATQIIEMSIVSNDLDMAIELAQQTSTMYQYMNPEESDKSRFLFAQILFFKGFIDSSKAILVSLAGKTDSDISNDALELSLFLEQHKQFQAGLLSWGKAMLYVKQKNFSKAVDTYREIVLSTKGTELAEQAQYSLCELMKDIDVVIALEESQVFLKEYPESIQTDKILFLIAEIYIQKQQISEAVTILTDILVRFPTSQYARKSREMIRRLRGDS
ncbi:MAG: tetratricopeptide repeat protein [Candidatus Kapaibacteriota bacterium]